MSVCFSGGSLLSTIMLGCAVLVFVFDRVE